jgi:hypothetical protein
LPVERTAQPGHQPFSARRSWFGDGSHSRVRPAWRRLTGGFRATWPRMHDPSGNSSCPKAVARSVLESVRSALPMPARRLAARAERPEAGDFVSRHVRLPAWASISRMIVFAASTSAGPAGGRSVQPDGHVEVPGSADFDHVVLARQ